MMNFAAGDQLIKQLAGDLTPVRRVAPPLRRSFVWLGVVIAIAAGLAALEDLRVPLQRFASSLDLCVSAAGSLLTAVLAVVAALQLSLPDRRPGWILLPLPAAALWIGASATGCLRAWTAMSAGSLTLGGTDHCLLFILVVSLSLSIIFILMLRSGYSLRPDLTAIACGLASAAAAATLLNLIHIHDETLSDLAVHAFAVSAVILANRIIGIRFLTANPFEGGRNKRAGQREFIGTTSCNPTSRAPHDWIDDVEDSASENRPASAKADRTEHQGHVIRFHRPGCDESGSNKPASSSHGTDEHRPPNIRSTLAPRKIPNDLGCAPAGGAGHAQ
jgi:hypothetical protein